MEIQQLVTTTIENVVKEICDFKRWWDKDFPCDLAYDTEEELRSFPTDDIETVQADYIYDVRNAVVEVVCERLGIDVYVIQNSEHQRFVEILHEMASDCMWKSMREQWE